MTRSSHRPWHPTVPPAAVPCTSPVASRSQPNQHTSHRGAHAYRNVSASALMTHNSTACKGHCSPMIGTRVCTTHRQQAGLGVRVRARGAGAGVVTGACRVGAHGLPRRRARGLDLERRGLHHCARQRTVRGRRPHRRHRDVSDRQAVRDCGLVFDGHNRTCHDQPKQKSRARRPRTHDHQYHTHCTHERAQPHNNTNHNNTNHDNNTNHSSCSTIVPVDATVHENTVGVLLIVPPWSTVHTFSVYDTSF